MTHTLHPDALDDLATVRRRLDILDAGGRVAEQQLAGRLGHALDTIGQGRGVVDARFADGDQAHAAAMLDELRTDVAAGLFGPLPSFVAWAVVRSGDFPGDHRNVD